jgi:hypothetical protein
MKILLAPVVLAVFLAGCDTASNVHKTVNKPKNTEITCHLSEQSVRNNMRSCVYKCQDGSPESASTESQFGCPTTIFKKG